MYVQYISNVVQLFNAALAQIYKGDLKFYIKSSKKSRNLVYKFMGNSVYCHKFSIQKTKDKLYNYIPR